MAQRTKAATTTRRRSNQSAAAGAAEVPGVLSIAEAAHELHIGTSTAYDALRRDEFPVRVVTIGRRQRVLRADLERYLNGAAGPAEG